MRKIIIVTVYLMLTVSVVAAADPVTESNVWTEVYPVTATTPSLYISNIWGNVRVRPGTSGQISVTIDERRSAPDQKRFDRSLEMLDLDIQADNEGVSFKVGERSRDWGRNGGCRGCRVDYQFEVLVPPGTQLDVGTIIDGRIDVAGVDGKISASNVNGPIAVSELQNCESLESVNGAVDLRFSMAPGQDCNIDTINGDITISMPSGSGLDVALDQFNGRMVSEFQVAALAFPAQIEQTSNEGRKRYRIQQSAGLRLEGGGPTFSISSMNGDVRIQKSQ